MCGFSLRVKDKFRGRSRSPQPGQPSQPSTVGSQSSTQQTLQQAASPAKQGVILQIGDVATSVSTRHDKLWKDAVQCASAEPEWTRYCDILVREQEKLLSIKSTAAGSTVLINANRIAEVANTARAANGHDKSGLTIGVDRFCTAMVKVKDIGAVLTALNPYAALGWGVAQFVVGAIGNNARIREACWSNLGAVESVVQRCEILSAIYEDFQKSAVVDKSSIDKEFIDLYTAIVRYQVSVVVNGYSKREYGKNMFTQKGDSLPEQLLETIQAKENQLLHQAELSHMLLVHRRIQDLQDNQNLSMQSIEHRLNSLEDKTSILVAAVERSERDKILQWIHPEAHWQAHARIKPAPGTCDWLFEQDEFRKWKDEGSLFWLRGTMGAGKSYLTHSVIETHLRRVRSHNEKVAYVYCGAAADSDDILRRLAKQLAQTDDDKTLPTIVMDHYLSRFDERPPRTETCLSWIDELVKSSSRATLIFDALDECPFDSRARLVAATTAWLSEDFSTRRVFVSSRDHRDIQVMLQGVTAGVLDIEVTEHNYSAIASFVEQSVRIASTTSRRGLYVRNTNGIEENQSHVVVSTIREHADGMFRWAELALNWLHSSRSFDALTNRLEDVRTSRLNSLFDMYDRVYEQLMKDADQNDKLAIRTILTYAVGAFNWEELFNSRGAPWVFNQPKCVLELCCFAAEVSTELRSVASTTADLSNFCPDFVKLYPIEPDHEEVYQESSEALLITHLSVSEYLLQRYVDLYGKASSHAYLATLCLKFLLKGRRAESNTEYEELAKYVNRSCLFHLNEAVKLGSFAEHHELAKCVEQFMLSEPLPPAFEQWQDSMNHLGNKDIAQGLNSLMMTIPASTCAIRLCLDMKWNDISIPQDHLLSNTKRRQPHQCCSSLELAILLGRLDMIDYLTKSRGLSMNLQHGCGGGRKGCNLDGAPLSHAMISRFGREKFAGPLPGKLCDVAAYRPQSMEPYMEELVARGLDVTASWDSEAPLRYEIIDENAVQIRQTEGHNLFFTLVQQNSGSTCFHELLKTLLKFGVDILQTSDDCTVLDWAVAQKMYQTYPHNFDSLLSEFIAAVPSMDVAQLSRALRSTVTTHRVDWMRRIIDLGGDPCYGHSGDDDSCPPTCLTIVLNDTCRRDYNNRWANFPKDDVLLPGLFRNHGKTIELLTAECAGRHHSHFRSIARSRPKGQWPFFARVVSQCELPTIKAWIEHGGAEPFEAFELEPLKQDPASEDFRSWRPNFEGLYTAWDVAVWTAKDDVVGYFESLAGYNAFVTTATARLANDLEELNEDYLSESTTDHVLTSRKLPVLGYHA